MKKYAGVHRVNDDEWYTPKTTSDKLARWLLNTAKLNPETHLLCPADLLPNGMQSTVSQALTEIGFKNVRVTRDLPLDPLFQNWDSHCNDGVGEIIVTNPPFSLLAPFRLWAMGSGAKFCVLSRPGSIYPAWPVIELTGRFRCVEGRSVAACWMQNLVDTRQIPPPELALGNCAKCVHPKCPQNVMTGTLSPGEDRPLYGWCNAVKYGIAGKHCDEYIEEGGTKHFCRFFY